MARRNPSRTLPSDRTPDTPPGRDRVGGGLDTLALMVRPLSPEEREWEANLVHLCIGRVRVAGDLDETAYTRAMLRSMLLGDR